jgi:starvation-inducible DNA-binding protein
MPSKTLSNDPSTLNINIGIEEKERKLICQNLSILLADSYLLYLKTQNYHWNVTGLFFFPLHQLFENQYKELSESIDEIAERIRSLGESAPGSFIKFNKIASIKEDDANPLAEEMIQNLVQDNEIIVTNLRDMITMANECEDDVSAELFISRMQVHEKNAWMLRSMLPSKFTH